MGVERVASVADAERLAADLNAASRDKPFVVVSTPAQRAEPYIDAAEIFEQVGDLARVHLLPTGAESWAFSRAMPELTQVYGGAGRAYPVGTDWVHDPRLAPLRLAFDESEGGRSTERLVADALRMASEAGLPTGPAAEPVEVDGTVQSLFAPSRALVLTASRDLASIWQELLVPDVDIDRLLAVGMPVHGTFDLETRRYDVRAMLLSPEECLDHYRVGDVVLAEVAAAQPERATLRLHPRVPVVVGRESVSSNELDLVSSLMSPGEVLAARVVRTGPDWALSLLDVDDDEEPLPAPSLLRGGPPWLVPRVVEPEVPAELPQEDSEEAPVAAVPVAASPADTPVPEPPAAPAAEAVPPPTPMLLDRRRDPGADRRELARLREDLDRALQALQRAEQQNDAFQRSVVDLRNERQLLHSQLERSRRDAARIGDDLRRSRTDLRKARQRAERSTHDRRPADPLFLDPDEQFRHEVYLAWAHRIPPGEKHERPLPDYAVGPDFLRSVAEIDGVDHGKIVDVVVEVVTGLVTELAGRDLHQLRRGEGGGTPPVVREEDGATCWRAALQVNSPQARRLHFWRLRDGSVELSRVVLHDDFAP